MIHHQLMASTIPSVDTNVNADAFCHHAIQKPVGANSLTLTLVDEICLIHQQLSQVESLKPGNQVNSLFTKLVTMCILQYGEETTHAVLNDARILSLISTLRQMASEGEYFLELVWATELAQEDQPNLSRFIYYQNYVDLVKLELHALEGINAKLENIVFIGSGPMPLSPILMYQTLAKKASHPVHMHNIDRDQASIDVSNTLLQKLDIHHGFSQHVMDATNYTEFDHADVVVLGALVGQDVQEKMSFLTQIGSNMRTGSYLMARSAHSLRKLLYPSIEPHQVNLCGFETVLVVHPFNDVVNSVLIAKKV